MAVDLSFYKSPLFEEVREEAWAQGWAEGWAQGQVQGWAESILDVFEVRVLDVPEAVRERVTNCNDLEILRRWHRRAITVSAAEDILTDDD